MRSIRTVALFSIGALSLASFAGSSHAATTFGTDANGNPITGWTQSAVPGTTGATDSTITTDASGLHINFNTTGGSQEVQVGDANFFGSNTNGTPWIQVGWIDNNTGGATAAPNIDFIASDTRAGKFNNYVSGGSLFGQAGASPADRVAVMRYNNGSTKENYTNFDTNRPAAGGAIPHTVRFDKLANGDVNTIYDGTLVHTSSWFANTSTDTGGDLGAGLGTDHSAWASLELRVRGGEAGETFTFTSLTMGNTVPEPASLSILGLGGLGLLARRRRA